MTRCKPDERNKWQRASGNNLTANAANNRGETTQSIASGNGNIPDTVTLSQPSDLFGSA